MKTENIRIVNNRGRELAGRHHVGNAAASSCVIYSHGLFSSKDAYKINRLSGDIVKAGYDLLTFDFSFAGDNARNVAEMSIMQEVEDLRSAVRCMLEKGYSSIHLMGSSMGGVVSLLFAADPGQTAIASMVIIATPVQLTDIFTGTHGVNVDDLPDEGFTAIEGIPLTNRFFKELKAIDVADAVRRIMAPVLIIHGAGDAVVPAANAYAIERLLPGDKKLVMIDDGDHNLTRESDIAVLRDRIIPWLQGGW
jgi:putative redox protein